MGDGRTRVSDSGGAGCGVAVQQAHGWKGRDAKGEAFGFGSGFLEARDGCGRGVVGDWEGGGGDRSSETRHLDALENHPRNRSSKKETCSGASNETRSNLDLQS